jgi:crotonobetaine/carnitine-CoA ligase
VRRAPRARAARGHQGGEVYAVFEGGERWTYADTLARVQTTAAALQALEVGRGDRILIMLPNSALGIRMLFATNYLGAVSVSINIAYRGAILEHVVKDSRASVAIVHPQLAERLMQVPRQALRQVVVAGPGYSGERPAGLEIHNSSALEGDARSLKPLDEPIQPWDLQSIIYTSDTTGRSKGVLSTYMHSYSALNPDTWTCLRADDRQLLHMPIFHIGGAFMASAALCFGGSIGVVPAFKTDTFWESVRMLGVTSVFLLGSMATFLLSSHPIGATAIMACDTS